VLPIVISADPQSTFYMQQQLLL